MIPRLAPSVHGCLLGAIARLPADVYLLGIEITALSPAQITWKPTLIPLPEIGRISITPNLQTVAEGHRALKEPRTMDSTTVVAELEKEVFVESKPDKTLLRYIIFRRYSEETGASLFATLRHYLKRVTGRDFDTDLFGHSWHQPSNENEICVVTIHENVSVTEHEIMTLEAGNQKIRELQERAASQ